MPEENINELLDQLREEIAALVSELRFQSNTVMHAARMVTAALLYDTNTPQYLNQNLPARARQLEKDTR